MSKEVRDIEVGQLLQQLHILEYEKNLWKYKYENLLDILKRISEKYPDLLLSAEKKCK